MTRHVPLRAHTPLRRRTRLARSQRLRSVSKRAQRVITPRWRAVVRQVRARAGGRCEVILAGVRCPARMDDPHHIAKRWRGRSVVDTPDNTIGLCRAHHDRAESWPFAKGRLVHVALGQGRFASRIITAPTKAAGRVIVGGWQATLGVVA